MRQKGACSYWGHQQYYVASIKTGDSAGSPSQDRSSHKRALQFGRGLCLQFFFIQPAKPTTTESRFHKRFASTSRAG